MATPCILVGQKNFYSDLVLSKIEILSPPKQLTYLAGEKFSKTGLKTQATFAIDNAPALQTEVFNENISVSPEILSDTDTEVTFSYQSGGIIASTKQSITVIHRLVGIQITRLPDKKSYEYGDNLNTQGMEVTATYSDNKKEIVTGWSYDPLKFNKVTDQQSVVVRYSENGVTVMTSFLVEVKNKPVLVPSQDSTRRIVYNETIQSPSWNNYLLSAMTIDGVTQATNAGTYQATFTLKPNYCWADNKTTMPRQVSWVIAKASPKLSFSSSYVRLTTANYAQGYKVTVNTKSTGKITASSSNFNVANPLVSGNTITIKGKISAPGTASISVSISEDQNYTASPSSLYKIEVTATYNDFDWNQPNSWEKANWSDIFQLCNDKNKILSKYVSIGKTKQMKMSSPVMKTTNHNVRVIDIDDDKHFLVFDTVDCLNGATQFGDDLNDTWEKSFARQYCQEYYNACEAKNYISQKTNINEGTTDYVWLLSLTETGIGSKTNERKYAFYTDNQSRKKKTDTKVNSGYAQYWTRTKPFFINENGMKGTGAVSLLNTLSPAFIIGPAR